LSLQIPMQNLRVDVGVPFPYNTHMEILLEPSKKIILLADLIDSRKRKQEELVFYNRELKRLEEKMHFLRLEINLTNCIIQMIEQEKVKEVRHHYD